MKKAFAFILAAALTFGTAAAASADYAFVNVQNASAYLEQDGHEVRLTVDLSDGWSVEFAHAAAYLYDGPNDGVKEAIAMGLTLEKQVYDEYLLNAEEMPGFRSDDGITTYLEEDGTQDYFFEVDGDSGAYFMVSVVPSADGDLIMSRFAVQSTNAADSTESAEGDEAGNA